MSLLLKDLGKGKLDEEITAFTAQDGQVILAIWCFDSVVQQEGHFRMEKSSYVPIRRLFRDLMLTLFLECECVESLLNRSTDFDISPFSVEHK